MNSQEEKGLGKRCEPPPSVLQPGAFSGGGRGGGRHDLRSASFIDGIHSSGFYLVTPLPWTFISESRCRKEQGRTEQTRKPWRLPFIGFFSRRAVYFGDFILKNSFGY